MSEHTNKILGHTNIYGEKSILMIDYFVVILKSVIMALWNIFQLEHLLFPVSM